MSLRRSVLNKIDRLIWWGYPGVVKKSLGRTKEITWMSSRPAWFTGKFVCSGKDAEHGGTDTKSIKSA